MEEFLRVGRGKHSYNVYRPLETKKSEQQSHITDLEQEKTTLDCHGRASYLPSAGAIQRAVLLTYRFQGTEKGF